MCKKHFNEQSILRDQNYNLVVSNFILSKSGDFTYDDIINDLNNMFANITDKIKLAVRKCLLRLRDDGFLSVLGAKYSVIKVNI